MVDVTRSSGVDPVSGTDRHKRQHERDEPGGFPPRQQTPRRSPRQIHDVAHVMGIPAAELTPRVQEALDIIVGEYDRTRSELDRERERVAYCQELADRDPLLPVLNPRALTRELARLINRAAQTRTVSSVAVLHLGGLEAPRLRRGRAVIDGVLRQVAERLIAELRASDLVASLGGADFAVVLTLTNGVAAVDKTQSLAEAARAEARERFGVSVEVAWGVAAFTAEDDAEQVIAAADGDLRRRHGDGA